MNPFQHKWVSYSMSPIMMTILNLPREIRNSFSNVQLLGIIPGPKTLNPYLKIVVDEFLTITNKDVFDAYSGATFQLKAAVLLHVLDYPGIGKLFHTMGSGAYQGCMWCEFEGRDVFREGRTWLTFGDLCD